MDYKNIPAKDNRKTSIWKKSIILILLLFVLTGAVFGIIWSQYDVPKVQGATMAMKASAHPTIEKVTEQWFQWWVKDHQGLRVPPSFRLKGADITSLEELQEGYIEVHYRAVISGWSKKVVQNLELISTDTKNEYDGQWVLKWQEGETQWEIEAAMSPVQYQMQTPEFAEEASEPQTAHFAYDGSREQSYYVQDGTLYVTYDAGENFTEVPNGYDPVCGTVNGTYDEYLSDGSYVVSDELTAFVGYANQQTILIYSFDKGKNWQESTIYDGGYRANTFLSKTENYCYVSFALDRTGGSDYYGSFRSSDLENWESVAQPDEVYSNASCVFWKDDDTGYYGKGDVYYLTQDGGASYKECAVPENEEITGELGYNPYDSLDRMYQEDGFVYMLLGQGDDGDYSKDGKLLRALYQSEDGIHFSFVEENVDTVEEAG